MPTAQIVSLIENNGQNRGVAGTGVSVQEKGNSIVHQSTIDLSAVSIAMTDHTTAGSQGSLAIYTFPQGLIRLLGARVNLTIARVGTAISATAAVVGSLGSAAVGTGDAVLTGTEADIHGSTACTLTSGAGAFAGVSADPMTDSTGGTVSTTAAAISAGGSYSQSDATAIKNAIASILARLNTIGRSVILDGTSSAAAVNLNFAIPDAGSTGNDALTVTGTITINWEYCGE